MPKDERPPFQHVIDQIEAFRKSERPLRTVARTNEHNSWNGELLKKRFQIVVAQGKLSGIKLRCEKKFLIFRYEPGVQYQVSGPSGSCNIEVVGEPDTNFELIQSWRPRANRLGIAITALARACRKHRNGRSRPFSLHPVT